MALSVGLGGYAAATYEPWAPVDEAAHFGYLESLAERGRPPLLAHDRLSARIAAIGHAAPGPSYEGFQPPLYYAVALPVYALAGSTRAQVDAVRGFDVALIVVIAAAVWSLARTLFPRDWETCLPFAGIVLLWPGVVVRSMTIGNDAGATAAALLALLATARAWVRPSLRRLALAALAFGACLLVKLTLAYLGVALLAALAAYLAHVRGWRPRLAGVAAAVAIPLAVLAPWVAFNEAHYDSPTANAQARAFQARWDGPSKQVHSLGGVADRLPGVALWTLPQEWVAPATSHVNRSLVARDKAIGAAIEGVLLALAAAALVLWPRAVGAGRAALLAAPVIACFALLAVATLAAHWDSLISRYALGAVPPLALLAGWAAGRLLRPSWLPVALALALTLATAGLWLTLVTGSGPLA